MIEIFFGHKEIDSWISMLRMYEGGGVENPAEVVKRLEQVDDMEMFDDNEEWEERGEVDGKEMFDDKEECEECGEVDGKEEVEEVVTMGLDCMTSRVEEQEAFY